MRHCSVRQTRAVRSLREELQLLQEPGSYVGEVVKVRTCLMRVHDLSMSAGQCVSCQNHLGDHLIAASWAHQLVRGDDDKETPCLTHQKGLD